MSSFVISTVRTRIHLGLDSGAAVDVFLTGWTIYIGGESIGGGETDATFDFLLHLDSLRHFGRHAKVQVVP